MNKFVARIYNGIIKENPTFVLMLGMCPTLAVTTSAINGMSMGLSTTVVLILSNMVISALRKIIPDKVRIPAFIVIVASFVTMVQLLIQGFLPALDSALGLYIPLIVVNCIILGRAESCASKCGVLESAGDGIGMGLGFTVALTCIGLVREILGAGSAFGFEFIPESFHISIFVLAPGAFFVLACLQALQNKFKAPSATNTANGSSIACGGNCAACAGSVCASNQKKLDDIKAEAEAKAAAEKAAKAKAAAEAKAAKAAEEAKKSE
jgi:electron transport complex protein RnfE